VDFKQIIGRGTRLFDGKDYFTIYDFVQAHHHFSDPEWDGEPMEPVPPTPRPIKPIDDYDIDDDDRLPGFVNEPDPPKRIIKIKLSDGKIRELQHMTRTSFWGPDGKPISSEQFLKAMFGTLPEFFKNEDELRTLWSRPDTRKKLLDELQEKGYPRAQLLDLQNLIQAENSDLYDVLAYVAFHSTPLERTTRATRARVHLNSNNPKQQAFLDFVLQQYVQSGIDELDDIKLPRLLELKYHAIADAKHELGDIKSIRETFVGFSLICTLKKRYNPSSPTPSHTYPYGTEGWFCQSAGRVRGRRKIFPL
jgi:type I restriction enzyme R subunit